MRAPRPALRWRNALGIAVVGAAAVGTALLVRHPAPTALPPALRTNPVPAIDLRDADTRRELELLMSRPRADADDLRPSLWHRCAEYEPDTLAVLASRAWVTDRYVEIRRNSGDSGATAYRWYGPRAPILGPYQPRYERLAERKPVSEAEYVDIDAEFSALTMAKLPAIRSAQALDGGGVMIESCRGGQYSLFVRRNVFDDDNDERIARFADRVLKLAGVVW